MLTAFSIPRHGQSEEKSCSAYWPIRADLCDRQSPSSARGDHCESLLVTFNRLHVRNVSPSLRWKHSGNSSPKVVLSNTNFNDNYGPISRSPLFDLIPRHIATRRAGAGCAIKSNCGGFFQSGVKRYSRYIPARAENLALGTPADLSPTPSLFSLRDSTDTSRVSPVTFSPP